MSREIHIFMGLLQKIAVFEDCLCTLKSSPVTGDDFLLAIDAAHPERSEKSGCLYVDNPVEKLWKSC